MARYRREHLEVQAREILHEVQPIYGGSSYRVVSDDRCTNHVMLVEGEPDDPSTPYVVKIPAWPQGENITSIDAEAETLRLLGDIKAPRVMAMPRLLGYDKGRYIVSSYVSGEPLNYDYICHNFSQDELLQFGKDIGRFIAWLGSNLSIEQATHIEDLKGKWEEMVRKDFAKYDKIAPDEYPKFHEALRDFEIDYTAFNSHTLLYGKNFGMLREHLHSPHIVGHCDLRPDNMTFLRDEDGKWKLHGVIDFGNTSSSTPEWEARHFMFFGRSIGRVVLQTCREQLGLDMSNHSQAVISEDTSYMWSQLHTLHVAFSRLTSTWPLQSAIPQLDVTFKHRGIGEELRAKCPTTAI